MVPHSTCRALHPDVALIHWVARRLILAGPATSPRPEIRLDTEDLIACEGLRASLWPEEIVA
jgi:hypothetical protein